MISGRKLRELRQLRNLTQKELAIKSRLTDASIRNYELGNRSPSLEQLRMIALALECDISALIDHDAISPFEFFQILFDYEDSYKLRPIVDEYSSTLGSFSSDLDLFLKEWDIMRKKHYDGEITDEQFRDWKLSYPHKNSNMIIKK